MVVLKLKALRCEYELEKDELHINVFSDQMLYRDVK